MRNWKRQTSRKSVVWADFEAAARPPDELLLARVPWLEQPVEEPEPHPGGACGRSWKDRDLRIACGAAAAAAPAREVADEAPELLEVSLDGEERPEAPTRRRLRLDAPPEDSENDGGLEELERRRLLPEDVLGVHEDDGALEELRMHPDSVEEAVGGDRAEEASQALHPQRRRRCKWRA